MESLLKEISKCKLCAQVLPNEPRPILASHPNSGIAIIGQAPGRVVHQTGIPWDDKSGERLRDWLNVTDEQFYNPKIFALIPMGFCYPGTGKSGDLAPRNECAPRWHNKVFGQIKNLNMTLLIGNYAQKYYLKDKCKPTLTETVKSFQEYAPEYFVLPHPSPRNNIWLKKNSWFESDLLPELRKKIKHALK